ncbi:MAG: SDR family oxidoreductase [Nitrospirae bacterium]|nr:SDR family oxidoreductase [Nitrospirota bacterium]
MTSDIHRQRQFRLQGREWLTGIHPIGRIGRPEEIAQASVYFASDESVWTTGTMTSAPLLVTPGLSFLKKDGRP